MRNLKCLWKVWSLLSILFFNPAHVINVHANVLDLRETWAHSPDNATFGDHPELREVMRTSLGLNFEREESQSVWEDWLTRPHRVGGGFHSCETRDQEVGSIVWTLMGARAVKLPE